MAKKQITDIVDEMVLQFTSRPGVKVRVSIHIEADSPSGVDDATQRAVNENCKVLKFKSAEFEAGEQGETIKKVRVASEMRMRFGYLTSLRPEGKRVR